MNCSILKFLRKKYFKTWKCLYIENLDKTRYITQSKVDRTREWNYISIRIRQMAHDLWSWLWQKDRSCEYSDKNSYFFQVRHIQDKIKRYPLRSIVSGLILIFQIKDKNRWEIKPYISTLWSLNLKTYTELYRYERLRPSVRLSVRSFI